MMAHCQISLFNSLIIQGNTWVKERKEYGIKVTWNWFCLAVWPDTVTIKFTACVKHIIILLKYTITQLLSTDESSYRVKNHPKRVTHQLSSLASKEVNDKVHIKCQMPDGQVVKGAIPLLYPEVNTNQVTFYSNAPSHNSQSKALNTGAPFARSFSVRT